MAGLSTLVCLLAGYPMALAIAQSGERRRALLLLLVMLPFWTGFLMRINAWIGLLQDDGWINTVLGVFGVAPLHLLYTDAAMYVGIVYTYLPFMVLPLYARLSQIDPALLEAAADLGAPPWRAFLRITLPLSLPGVWAGALLVFIPAVGEYVIPELLGGPQAQLIGRVLWGEFFQNRDWPTAAAVAVVLLALLLWCRQVCWPHPAPSDAEADTGDISTAALCCAIACAVAATGRPSSGLNPAETMARLVPLHSGFDRLSMLPPRLERAAIVTGLGPRSQLSGHRRSSKNISADAGRRCTRNTQIIVS